jgi:hypothetical protein
VPHDWTRVDRQSATCITSHRIPPPASYHGGSFCLRLNHRCAALEADVREAREARQAAEAQSRVRVSEADRAEALGRELDSTRWEAGEAVRLR